METYTDCRSEEGVTVGLLDSLITTCRVLWGRDLSSAAIQEALKDVYFDEDVINITTYYECKSKKK